MEMQELLRRLLEGVETCAEELEELLVRNSTRSMCASSTPPRATVPASCLFVGTSRTRPRYNA